MNHAQVEGNLARQSALIYVPFSLGAALLFLLLATFTGDYPSVARLGGAVWVGLLTLIISMPIVTTWVKGRRRA